MIYIIYGDEQHLINEEINKIINDNKDAFISKYDDTFSKKTCIFDALEECSSVSFLHDKTIVLYRNPSFLISKQEDDIINAYLEYLNNQNNSNDLVLYSSYSSFNSKLKAFKESTKSCTIKYYSKLDPRRFKELCESEIQVSKIDIDDDAKSLFIENCGQDLSIFYSGLNNLKQLESKITIDSLKQLTYASDDFNIFSLVNLLIDGKLTRSIKLVRMLKNDESSIFWLFSLIAGQLRYLYSVYYYQTIYKTEKEVMEATSTNNPYRLEMANKTLKKISPINIQKLLYKISSFDYKLKTDSSIDHNVLFELFVTTLRS